MNTAILNKELLLLLRQKRVFVVAGILYSILAISVALRWSEVALSVNRAEISRGIFYILLGLGYYVFFTFHGLQVAVRVMAQEKDRGTATLLRVSPLSPSSILFQKLLTPLAIEWLLLIGTLPFLSLTFLLGGIPPLEFVYQIFTLFLWLNTVVLIGLFVSTTRGEATKHLRTAWGLILLLLFLLPWLSSLFFLLVESMEGLGVSVFPAFVAGLLHGLSALSPFQMVASYDPNSIPATPFYTWPILPAWIGHLVIEAILFVLAVRNWRRFSEDRTVSVNPGEAEGLSSLLRWNRLGRRTHEGFDQDWRIFREMEEREVYPRRKPGTPIKVFSLLFLLIYVGVGGQEVIVGGMVLIGFATLVATLGLSSNSFKKEIQNGSATFLLLAPIDPTEIVLGKWIFYLKQGTTLCLFGFFALGLSWMFNAMGVPSLLGPVSGGYYLGSFVGCGILLCFVPLLSLVRIAENLKVYPTFAPYFLLVGLLCCPPIGFTCLNAVVGTRLLGCPESAIRNSWIGRLAVMSLGWICLLMCLVHFLLILPFMGILDDFTGLFYGALAFIDFSLLPLATGVYLWCLICDKSNRWWRARLLSEEMSWKAV